MEQAKPHEEVLTAYIVPRTRRLAVCLTLAEGQNQTSVTCVLLGPNDGDVTHLAAPDKPTQGIVPPLLL